MTSSPALVWFRLDLRRNDNPALYHAYESGRPIIPLYILDKDEQMSDWPMGAASKLWLHHSLQSLNDSLNSNLVLRTGSAADIIPAIAAEYDVQYLLESLLRTLAHQAGQRPESDPER